MGPDPQTEAGLLTAFAASVRRHPAVSVPLAAAALVAALGFSVSAYTFAATVAQAEDLHVPEDFVPTTQRVVLVGRGVIVAGLLALVGFMVIVLLDHLTRRLRGRRPARTNRPLHRWLASLSPGFEFSARVVGLLTSAAALTLVWLNCVALAAFVWTPNPIGDGWLIAETFGTDTPVLVLENENGDVLLRPLSDLGNGRFAPCGSVTRPAAGDHQDLRYVEELGRLASVEDC